MRITRFKIKLAIDLKAKRIEAGMSAPVLSLALDIHRNTLDRIEAGFPPSLPQAIKIADFYSMPMEAIWILAEKTPTSN